MRHEVNLQTKAVRAQQEQNSETLRQLGLALEVLRARTTEQRPSDGADEQQRGLLKTLVDLYDALGLGAREVAQLAAVAKRAAVHAAVVVPANAGRTDTAGRAKAAEHSVSDRHPLDLRTGRDHAAF